MKGPVVMHVISSMRRGGRERQLAILCKYSHRIDNRIICFYKDENGYINEYGLQNQTTYVLETGFWARVRKVRSLVRDVHADIVISWGSLESTIALALKVLYGINYINFSIRHGIRKAKLSHFYRAIVLHLSKYVVANSIAGLRANNLKSGMVLYNGIATIPPRLDKSEKMIKRAMLIGNHDGPVFISVANLVPYKDYPTVLEALSSLKDQGWTFYYVIVGDGPRRAEIEAMVEQCGLAGRVLFTGRIENVAEFLDISDVLIHSSIGEGCSNAILEGMAHGLPVLATNVGGTPEIVTEHHARLFAYEDVLTLKSHLEDLLASPDLALKMGEESRTHVKQRFSLQKMIDGYEAIINAVISKDTSELARLLVRI